MAPNRPPKRRKGPTPRKEPAGSADHPAGASHPHLSASVPAGSKPRIDVEANSRYTPKQKARGPFRPTWHKVVGALTLLAGVAIFIINDLAWFDINIIPGGHNELYAMLAFVVAGTSTWWFGWFDRPEGKTW
jgi:hypothetical protein